MFGKLTTTLVFVFCFFYTTTNAQSPSISIKGKLLDAETGEPLIGATVFLLQPNDSTGMGKISNPEGIFEFPKVRPGNYKLRVTFVGYTKFEKNIAESSSNIDLGTFEITPSTETLDEVTIEQKAPIAVQKGDTTEFNAQSFKVNPDADAEDLIKKMPGVVVENGTVQAQGEDVQEVLVDGKKFFGNDPTLALRSLPAEVIEKIQVFDRMTDQSQFTGFDDGNRSKTINIITKPDKRNGKFGKIYGGVGSDERYHAGGNVNVFNGDRRISLIGQSNNVNVQNFSQEDLLGVVSSGSSRGGRGGGRRGGGGGGRSGGSGGDANDFLVGSQNGISQTSAFGLNYTDQWTEKIEVNGSYFFNMSGNDLNQITNQEFIIPNEENQFYEEVNRAESDNMNHRINMRIDYKIDSANSILFTPSLSLQSNQSITDIDAQTTQFGNLLNETSNFTNNDLDGYNYSGNLLYRHKFKKDRRTISFNIGSGANNNSGLNSLMAINNYPMDMPPLIDTLDQQTNIDVNGYNVSSSIRYTEPITKSGMLQLSYDVRYNNSESDRRTFAYLADDGEYSELDTALSNVFESEYTTHQVSTGYMHREGKSMFMVRAGYQMATLENSQQFPAEDQVKITYNNILPMAMYMYRVSRQKNLRIFYRTNTQQPSVTQLQNVVDNSNPLQISVGNPLLDQQYQHTVVGRYSSSNIDKASTFFVMLSSSMTDNYIANSTLIASRDTVVLDGVEMKAGSQLSLPTNLDGYWNIRSFITYGFPVGALKSNLNLNFGVTYSKIPSMVNFQKNFSNTTDFKTSIVLSSNISENVDFTLSSISTYNITTNSTQEAYNQTYVNQNTKGEFYWKFLPKTVFRTDVAHQYYVGLSDGFNQNYILWNASLAKNVLKDERGELKLTVFDLLNQNTSIQRNVNDAYIEDVQTNVLQRYLMLTFTYRIRHFGTASNRSQQRPDFERGGRPPFDGGGPPRGGRF
ncbi:TonB-dependent receptor [Flammeovirgaceae bacterium SG7u.111]|nr:TonB-dependent receptor [Flammeovirgaceae bacterium SG7u.132]WPO35679.1 TonB-dependent receptor [Flammeovirgaceae bacterium SG7u.111]